MAITSFTTYTTKTTSPHQTVHSTKAGLTSVAGRMYSLWAATPDAGAAPTTAAVPTNATAGAIGQQDGGSTARRLIQAMGVSSSFGGMLIVCDRLSHQGGLDATSIAGQTTNLPTAALTRYTSGVNVFAALEIYTQIGTTGTTVTASYTDEAGNTGQTSIATVFGGTGFREAGRFIPLPLAAGDSGVRAVARVTLAASTLTAGNFGVTLFKPLYAIPIINNGSMQYISDPLITSCGNLPEVFDGACLFYLYVCNTSNTGVLTASLKFADDDT